MVDQALQFDRAAARARVERLFTVDRMVQEYLQVYSTLVKRDSGQAEPGGRASALTSVRPGLSV